MPTRGAAALAVAACALVAVPVLVFGALEVRDLFDPCHSFGAGNPSTLTPTQECPRVSASSETRAQAVVRLLLFNGTVLTAAGLGIGGALRRDPVMQFASATLFLAVALIPFNSMAPAFALAAAAVAWSGRGTDARSGLPRAAAWSAGAVGAALAAYFLVSLGVGMWYGLGVYALFSGIVVAAGAAVAWAGWWPVGAGASEAAYE